MIRAPLPRWIPAAVEVNDSLRTHVADSTDGLVTRDASPVSLQTLGDAEVDELHLPAHHDEVGRLEVRVNDA